MKHEARDDDDSGREDEHISDIEGACGCVEIWEQLSEKRRS
jgi:hypothetical protein